MLKRDSVKRDQNFEGMWVRPEFSDEKNESGVKCEAHANLLLPVLYQFWGMRDFRRMDNKLEDPTGIQ